MVKSLFKKHMRSNRIVVSIYARNFNIDPSTYYGITQINRIIDDIEIKQRSLIPDSIFVVFSNKLWMNKQMAKLRQLMLACVSWIRTFFFLLVDMISNPNIIIINRSVFPHYAPFLLFSFYKYVLSKTNVLWRYDDNIQLSGEISKKENDFLLKVSYSILAENVFLKDQVPAVYQSKLVSLFDKYGCDSDIKRDRVLDVQNNRIKSYSNEVRLIWLGSASGMNGLNYILFKIEEASKRVVSDGKRLVLTVVSDKPIDASKYDIYVNNIKWSREIAVQALYDSHIGLMPLITNEFNKGKSAFKITQYKAAGLPTIASDLPIHRDKLKYGDGIIVSDENIDEWVDAIYTLSTDVERWRSMSEIALRDIEQNYISQIELAETYQRYYTKVASTNIRGNYRWNT